MQEGQLVTNSDDGERELDLLQCVDEKHRVKCQCRW
jgi:hypothetical protein